MLLGERERERATNTGGSRVLGRLWASNELYSRLFRLLKAREPPRDVKDEERERERANNLPPIDLRNPRARALKGKHSKRKNKLMFL